MMAHSEDAATPPGLHIELPEAATAPLGQKSAKDKKNHKGRRQMDDDFMQYLYKIKMCTRSTPHNWKLCPWAHPGETAANRRHPSCHMAELCPAVRQHQECPHGETCLYARNTFECWLHPYKYRTTMCSSGEGCNRNICFFAHNEQELRSPPDVSQQWAAVAAAQQQGMEQQATTNSSSMVASGSSGPLMSVMPMPQHADSAGSSLSSPLPYLPSASLPWGAMPASTQAQQLQLAMQQQQQQSYLSPAGPAAGSAATGSYMSGVMMPSLEQVQVQHKQLQHSPAAGYSSNYNMYSMAADGGAAGMMAPSPGSSATKLALQGLQLSAADAHWQQQQHQQQAALQQAALLLQQLQLSGAVTCAGSSQLSADSLAASSLMMGSASSTSGSTVPQLTHLSAASDLSTDSLMMPAGYQLASCSAGMATQDLSQHGGSAQMLSSFVAPRQDLQQLLALDSCGLIQLSALDDCGVAEPAAPGVQPCQVTMPMMMHQAGGSYW